MMILTYITVGLLGAAIAYIFLLERNRWKAKKDRLSEIRKQVTTTASDTAKDFNDAAQAANVDANVDKELKLMKAYYDELAKDQSEFAKTVSQTLFGIDRAESATKE
jgi:hypothetical protein